MLTLIGCIMTVLTGALIGAEAANSLSRRRDCLRSLCLMARLIKNCLSCEYMSAAEIAFSLSLDPRLKSLGLFDEPSLAHIRANILSIPFVPQETRLSLERYFESFGQHSLEGEVARTDILLTELEAAYEPAREKAQRLCRLYRVLGLCGGLGAVILII